MADTTLHLPPDWERKATVRKLVLRLKTGWKDLVPLYFIRMWTEWASNPEEWRPLNFHLSDLTAHPWGKEDMTFIIEQACGWSGDPGVLLVAAIEAGVYEVKARGDISGLTMPDWEACNAHLMPGYESIQSRGGKAARVVTQRALAARMADQQRTIFESQGSLLLNQQTQSAEEQKAALALVIQVDRHCGRPVRASSQYGESLIRDAVGIVRLHPQPSIDLVLGYLHANRTNPQVVKVPEEVLAKFSDYLALANVGIFGSEDPA